jgi:hypothetical protein
MTEPRNIVVERVKVREVTGVVPAGDPAQAVIDALLIAGFDRADIDVLANDDKVRRQLDVPVPPEELPDVPEAPRHALVTPVDVSTLTVLVIALAAAAGGIGGAIANAAADSDWLAGLAATVSAMLLTGGLAALIARRFIERREPNLDRGGDVVIWVRVRSPEAEQRAQAVLAEQDARAVRVHEVDLDKRFRDVPLSSFLAKELVR